MRTLTGIETVAVRMANEVIEVADMASEGIHHLDETKIDKLEDSLSYLAGYADALKAFIEAEAEHRGGFVVTCNGTETRPLNDGK